MKHYKFYVLLIYFLFALLGCTSSSNQAYDTNTEVPENDPDFPALEMYWVIDQTGLLNEETITNGDIVLEELKQDGIAEIVIVLINGVEHPEDWATHYGRWLKLGEQEMSTEGGNNGVVWLIRPDANEKLTISVGRGLPAFTSVKYKEIIIVAIEYFNFNNFNRGVEVLISETDGVLREIYGETKQE
ncbi:TPM domain-containing protein [Patescibacteria group bacterium]